MKSEKKMIGRALVKHHSQMIQQSKDKNNFYRSQGKKVLESITHMKDIDAIMEQADEAELIFSSTHPGPKLVINLDSGGIFNDDITPAEKSEEQKKEQQLHSDKLCIPRRPPWNALMSMEELESNEKQSFLKWRRDIARLEENEKLVITPFEKNLNIWRQLWRVVERSHLLVMVVDARDPLFYRCPDLEAYGREVNKQKKTLLLVNKADLLPSPVRREWADYFRLHGILFAFWSAKSASVLLGRRHSPEEEEPEKEKEEQEEEEKEEEEMKICGRDELLARLLSEADEVAGAASTRNPVVVGFVGYPNVGKSSTINALMGEKKTGVTSTPGKTKHFQTLIISDTMTLCDCPGLVFPSFASSRHDMVAAGVLPIDRMTQPRSAVQAVAVRVPRHVLEQVYNISLPRPKPYEPRSRPPTASELLRAYCTSRGHVSSAGLPDETRASRQILKDFMDGKLPHFELPPWGDDRDSSFDEKGSEPPSMEHLLSDLGGFEREEGGGGRVKAKPKKMEKKASHKMHKKPPRKKDRSWRVSNDGSDGMPVVRAHSKPINNGPFEG